MSNNISIQSYLTNGTKIATINGIDIYSPDYNRENLAKVAFSGNYKDLNAKPYLASIAISGKYEDLQNIPLNANIISLVKYENDKINSNEIMANFHSLGVFHDIIIPEYDNFYQISTKGEKTNNLQEDLEFAIADFLKNGKLLIINSLYRNYIVTNIVTPEKNNKYAILTLQEGKMTNYDQIRNEIKNNLDLIHSKLEYNIIDPSILILDNELNFMYFN